MSKPAKILVAEDEAYNLLYIEEVLSGMEIEILSAQTGKQALDLVNKNPDVKLVLMDVKMPELDGYHAAIEIHKLYPEIPVVAQTAYALENEIEQYGDAFDEYLTKPIYKEKLRQIIRKYVFDNKI